MKMNKTAIILGSLYLLASTNMAHAHSVLYNVTGVFDEPASAQTGNTTFAGTFNWNAETSTLTDFQGTMNAAMWPNATGGAVPDYTLNNQLAFDYDAATGTVVASVFTTTSTDMFFGGGFETNATSLRLGALNGLDGFTPNENTYFTMGFNANTMSGILDEMVYGDCAPTGLMGPLLTGDTCMTGFSQEKFGNAGSMGGFAVSLDIAPVSAVPVPAAVWLFGSGLVGLVGVARRKQI